MNFSVDHHRVGPVEILQINGELDAEASELLIACSEASLADVHHLVLDLSRTTFLDCRGLSALLGVARSARRAGGWARAADVQGSAALLFDTFDVWRVLGGRHPVSLEVRRAFGAAAAIASLRPVSHSGSDSSARSVMSASGG